MRWWMVGSVAAAGLASLLLLRRPSPAPAAPAVAEGAAEPVVSSLPPPVPEKSEEIATAIEPAPAVKDAGRDTLEPGLHALRNKLCAKDADCCSYDADASPRELRVHRLDADSELFILSCSTFGYNREESLWVARNGGEPEPARFAANPAGLSLYDSPAAPPAPDAPKSWLTTPWYEEHLSSAYCVRGICDAGTQVDYAWDGRKFHVIRVRARFDDCCAELEDIGAWPVIWPQAERCEYRWRVREGAVELVTIMPRGERAQPVAGLPAPCTTESNGLLLYCADNNVPVTSQGDDWVVWQRSGTFTQPGEATVHQRVPRGCKL